MGLSWLFLFGLLTLHAPVIALVFLGVSLGGVLGLRLLAEMKRRIRLERELNRANAALGERVKKRTSDLTHSNHQLIQEVQKHRLTEDLLRDSEERYRHLVELSPDAILICKDLHIQYINGVGCRLLGCEQGQIVGKNLLEFVPAEDQQATRERTNGLSVDRPASPFREMRLRSIDGRHLEVESAAVALKDKDGISVQIVMRDVTEKKVMEARFLRTQRLESIGTLAGGIAHDLNNLLTPILMAVRLLRKERPQSERIGLLNTAEASIQRGSEMVKQLLAFTGGAQTRQVPVDLTRIVDEVASLLRHTLPKSIRLDIDLARDLPPVLGDPTQLAQVLMNLCINARDAMPDGGVLRVNAAVRGVDASEFLAILVQDTGIGISAENLERIFDPFFTTKEKGKGTGLGLSTALGIIRAHKGTIQADSVVNQGTTFTILLPTHDTALPQAAEQSPPRLERGQGQTIMVVDDEGPIRETLTLALEGAGYRVIPVGGGAEALERLSNDGDVHAMILDMMMPDMDGVEVLKRLLQLKPTLPVIASTGVAVASRSAEVLGLGAKAFLQKPYSDDRLLATLAEVLKTVAP